MKLIFRSAAMAAATTLLVTACADDGAQPRSAASTSAPAATTAAEATTNTTSPAPGTAVEPATPTAPSSGAPQIDAARCEANRAAGTITFLTGFDFAAASSIVEVIYAKRRGLFDQMCLDVELKSSFSTQNYQLINAGTATFASGGSFAEAMAFAGGGADNIEVVQVDAHVPIDTLMLKPGTDTLADVRGKTIGVKGNLPPSIRVMLSQAGLTADTDYQTVLLDGFDPTAHYQLDSIVGFPGWRSNEPGQLAQANLAFTQFNAADAGVPGSFGVVIANREFVAKHPSAAEDFVRATAHGLQLAIQDPVAASASALAMVEAGGNPNYLSPTIEVFRWQTEAKILSEAQIAGRPVGYPDRTALQAEIDAYTPTGLFEGLTLPTVDSLVNTDLFNAVSSGDQVTWPN